MNSSKFVRLLLQVIGTFFVCVGIVGIFLPLLPTTPFLLLAAMCYARSSDKLYMGLLNNKYLGSYIRNDREKKGIPMNTKILAISLLVLSIGYTLIFATQSWPIRTVLILIFLAISSHIILFPTLKK
ncbi:MAG: YbaN family protein [Endomicrobiia bacterium]